MLDVNSSKWMVEIFLREEILWASPIYFSNLRGVKTQGWQASLFSFVGHLVRKCGESLREWFWDKAALFQIKMLNFEKPDPELDVENDTKVKLMIFLKYFSMIYILHQTLFVLIITRQNIKSKVNGCYEQWSQSHSVQSMQQWKNEYLRL